MIVSLYAGILALIYIQLTMKVVKARRKYQVSLGHDDKPELARAIRAHANFIEYVPFTLILIFLNEYQGLASHYCHALGAALLIGRLFHASAVSQISENLRFRVLGMMLTLISMLFSAISLLLMPINM